MALRRRAPQQQPAVVAPPARSRQEARSGGTAARAARDFRRHQVCPPVFALLSDGELMTGSALSLARFHPRSLPCARGRARCLLMMMICEATLLFFGAFACASPLFVDTDSSEAYVC